MPMKDKGITRTADELHALVKRILLAAGADEENAESVAQHLVLANLSGVDTHGIWHIPSYVAAIKAGEILPSARPEILEESATSVLVSGHWTFGQVAAKYAMEVAVEKAREQNVAIAGLLQSNHIGRLGHYVEMAESERMVGMVWAGGLSEEEPTAAPYGGKARVLHTNPLAVGFPANEESPMMFDWATTALSGVKVINAVRRGEALPPDCIIDKDGNPSTDPNDCVDGGSYLPFGAHKGYAVMMAVEFLGRIFTGSDAYAEAERAGPTLRHQGVTMIVFKADLFRPFAEYAGQADEMQRRVRAIPPAPGFKEVLAPGDMESRTRVARRRDGIPIAGDVWQGVLETANLLGVPVP